MSHFYATIPTSARKTTPTAQGSVDTGITTETASWAGYIKTRLYEYRGVDWFEVTMEPWHGKGDTIVLASGHVGDVQSVICPLNAPSKR